MHLSLLFARFIIPEWLSFDQNKDTCKWNFTSTGEAGDCQMGFNDTSSTPFYIELQTQNFSMFRFSDILSFNMTFSVDPNDVLPKGKGDVPSMVVAYATCLPSEYAGWGTQEELCGPFKGEALSNSS